MKQALHLTGTFARTTARLSPGNKALLCSAPMHELLTELKHLIVESLQLEDISPDSIDENAPLFDSSTGLALDSIDALELAVALSKKYGVTLKADDENTRAVFSSVSSLAEYISKHRS